MSIFGDSWSPYHALWGAVTVISMLILSYTVITSVQICANVGGKC